MNIIFLNIGWMRNYRGIDASDTISGSAKYLNENDDGYEKYNFLPREDDYCYGYARIKDSIKLERIVSSAIQNEKIENVTVVFFSKSKNNPKAYIVGWYSNATLYRHNQLHNPEIESSQTKIKDNIDHELEEMVYICKTKKEHAYLVPEPLRDFIIPHSKDPKNKGGYGQSTIWYGDNTDEIFINNVIDYINEKKPLFRDDGEMEIENSTRMNSKKISNEDKVIIEKTAIAQATRYFETKGFEVQSVESDNCGWDLTATKDNKILYLEVKGRGAEEENTFQLTPNEFYHLKKHINIYRVVFVNNCFGDTPNLTVYKFEYFQTDNRFHGIIEYTNSTNMKKIVLEELVYAKGIIAE